MKFFVWLTIAIVGMKVAAGKSSLHIHPYHSEVPDRDPLRTRVLSRPKRRRDKSMEPNLNQHALNKMSDAQREMAQAFSHYQQLLNAVETSFAAFQEASDTSINQNCPQYQMIADELSGAYGELFGALRLLMVPFNHPRVSTMIRAGQEQSAREQQA